MYRCLRPLPVVGVTLLFALFLDVSVGAAQEGKRLPYSATFQKCDTAAASTQDSVECYTAVDTLAGKRRNAAHQALRRMVASDDEEVALDGQSKPTQAPAQTRIRSVSTPSFDCRKATTTVEKMICADPALGTLDSKMSRLFEALLALRTPPEREEVVAGQAQWLVDKRNAAPTPADLKTSYENRVDELSQFIACTKSADLTQSDLNMCSAIEFRNASAELAAALKSILTELRRPPDADAEAAEVLLAAQNAWSSFSDAQCEWDSYPSRGGSMHNMELFDCATASTRARTKELREWRKRWIQGSSY